MTETTTGYFETLVCGDNPDGSADWHYICNVCARRVDTEPCPDHSPTNIPGLRVVTCDKPGHHRVWFIDGDYYEPPCMYCLAEAQAERIAYFERCRHWPWRRTRAFKWLASRAYVLGIVNGYGISHGGQPYGHDGCAHGFRWRGRRHYLLGRQR